MKNHLLLFISKKAEDFQSIIDQFTGAAVDFKGKVGSCQTEFYISP